jgi:hypothetical protein
LSPLRQAFETGVKKHFVFLPYHSAGREIVGFIICPHKEIRAFQLIDTSLTFRWPPLATDRRARAPMYRAQASRDRQCGCGSGTETSNVDARRGASDADADPGVRDPKRVCEADSLSDARMVCPERPPALRRRCAASIRVKVELRLRGGQKEGETGARNVKTHTGQ